MPAPPRTWSGGMRHSARNDSGDSTGAGGSGVTSAARRIASTCRQEQRRGQGQSERKGRLYEQLNHELCWDAGAAQSRPPAHPPARPPAL